MHAANWPGAFSASGGTILAQSASFNGWGQRGWKGHPEGGSMGLGTSPARTIPKRCRPRTRRGAAAPRLAPFGPRGRMERMTLLQAHLAAAVLPGDGDRELRRALDEVLVLLDDREAAEGDEFPDAERGSLIGIVRPGALHSTVAPVEMPLVKSVGAIPGAQYCPVSQPPQRSSSGALAFGPSPPARIFRTIDFIGPV